MVASEDMVTLVKCCRQKMLIVSSVAMYKITFKKEVTCGVLLVESSWILNPMQNLHGQIFHSHSNCKFLLK